MQVPSLPYSKAVGKKTTARALLVSDEPDAEGDRKMEWNAMKPAALKEKVQRRFYHAVVFLFGVTKACEINRQPVPFDLSWHQNDSSETLFKELINKLCQFCDVRHGGESVTAGTVLRLQGRIQYCFACNKKDPDELERNRIFVTDLLGNLRNVTTASTDLRTRLLAKVLDFCGDRVRYYLSSLRHASKVCMETNPADATLMCQLRELETITSRAETQSLNAIAFTRHVDSLVALIESIQSSEDSVFRERPAQSSMNQTSNYWSELRHYAGRLLSYSHGVSTLMLAAASFPALFTKVEVVFIPSSRSSGNPFQLTATSKRTATEQVLRTVTNNTESARNYQSLVEEAKVLALEDTFRKLAQNETFRPRVHAELLVLQFLERAGLTHPSHFFNSWKYIGSSKPTCKLCDYYFRAHTAGFQVRPTHGNLYHKWKPPDVYQRDGEAAIRARENMLQTMAPWIREEALRILREKAPRGKQHDSSTGTTFTAVAMGRPVVAGLPGAADDLETFYEDPEDSFG
ncbi:hypothetical protein VPNG_01319 [Cytospora leucostoma]|uniref:Uncharacterized protein n=1 Tax=Cytospora leucostoma TaxID=1230097 RepID=A0A423XL92_9PEZI|nr:hypothetical protein VPNG_01319 [Cytospora leucostoma]